MIVPKLVPNAIEETHVTADDPEQENKSNSGASSNSNESLGPYLLKRYRMREQNEVPINKTSG